jgi:hypothetical protein
MFRKLIVCASVAAALFSAAPASAQSWIDWRSKQNLDLVHASAVEKEFVLTDLGRPGGMYYPGDAAEVPLAVPDAPKQPIDGATIELVRVHNRNAAKGEVGFVLVTTPPRIEIEPGTKPTRVKLDAPKTDTKQFKVKLPLQDAYGVAMLLLERKDGSRTFLGSIARVHKPTPRKGDYAHVLAEAGVSGFTHLGETPGSEALAATYERMGITALRWEFHWQQDGPDKPFKWEFLDAGMVPVTQHHIKVLNTMGAQPPWSTPLGGTTPAVAFMQDCVAAEKYDGLYGKWVEALVKRYYKDGKEGLWCIEHWNEPWEPFSTSGWQSDSVRYRQLLEVLSKSARGANPGIKIAAACSVMNTEDKLTSDGSPERMKWIDFITDHYVTPCNCYGPKVAAKYGLVSGETETWGAATEVIFPQFMTQFLAAGDKWVNPMTGDMPLEEIGSKEHPLPSPKPLSVAVSAWNAIVQDRPFNRVVFTDRLPWLYQFGDDGDAALVLYGKAMPLASGNVRDLVWRQAAEGPEGTLTITDTDGALVVMDMEGNALKPESKVYRVPMSNTAFYLQSKKGAAYVTKCVAAAKIEGLRQVEVLPVPIAALPGAKPAELHVELHNLRNVALRGEFKAASLVKESPLAFSAKVEVPAGESTVMIVPLDKFPAGGIPANFSFATAEATDTWQEVIRTTGIAHATVNLDDTAAWEKLAPVVVIKPEGNDTGDAIERAWLPFVAHQESKVPAKHGETRLAWDNDFLYISGSVESPKPVAKQRLEQWDEGQYFYSAKSDELCEQMRPYADVLRKLPGDPGDRDGRERVMKSAEFAPLAKYLEEHPDARTLVMANAPGRYFEAKARDPKATLADAHFVYIKDFSVEQVFNGDTFQFSFDLDSPADRLVKTHDLKFTPGTLPAGYTAVPDTDYEFSLYNCLDGKPEMFCILSPGMPRVHMYPRQPHGKTYPFPVKEAKTSVAYENGRAIYRIALPWKTLGVDRPVAGMDFGFTFRFNAAQGNKLAFGEDMATTKSNSLSMHPYWEATPSCTVRWTLLP